jgi:hypothetical protein
MSGSQTSRATGSSALEADGLMTAGRHDPGVASAGVASPGVASGGERSTRASCADPSSPASSGFLRRDVAWATHLARAQHGRRASPRRRRALPAG